MMPASDAELCVAHSAGMILSFTGYVVLFTLTVPVTQHCQLFLVTRSATTFGADTNRHCGVSLEFTVSSATILAANIASTLLGTLASALSGCYTLQFRSRPRGDSKTRPETPYPVPTLGVISRNYSLRPGRLGRSKLHEIDASSRPLRRPPRGGPHSGYTLAPITPEPE